MPLIIGIIVFIATLITWVVFIGDTQKTPTWLEIEYGSPELDSNRKSKKKLKFIRESERIGLKITETQYYFAWVGIGLLALFIANLLENFMLFFVFIIASKFLETSYLFQQERNIREKAKNQLGPALQNLGSAFRTQKNWSRALETVIPMLNEPLRTEFEIANNAYQTGLPIGIAFREMMERLKVPEMQLFVTMAEISEQVGGTVAEGIFVSGSYFQMKRLAAADLANAMMGALGENKMLAIMFIGIVLYFRLFQEQIFSGYLDSIIGKILLTVYISIALISLIWSYSLIRKEL